MDLCVCVCVLLVLRICVILCEILLFWFCCVTDDFIQCVCVILSYIREYFQNKHILFLKFLSAFTVKWKVVGNFGKISNHFFVYICWTRIVNICCWNLKVKMLGCFFFAFVDLLQIFKKLLFSFIVEQNCGFNTKINYFLIFLLVNSLFLYNKHWK